MSSHRPDLSPLELADFPGLAGFAVEPDAGLDFLNGGFSLVGNGLDFRASPLNGAGLNDGLASDRGEAAGLAEGANGFGFFGADGKGSDGGTSITASGSGRNPATRFRI